jgi:myo-inositol catabolism protein IolC
VQLYNEPIDITGTTPTGAPQTLHWRGGRLDVRDVRAVWQVAGEGRLYRVGVTVDGRLGIAEIAQQGDTGAWRLRHLWL